MSLFIVVLIILVCIFLEGFFSGSELALVVADKFRLKNRADMGDKEAKMTQKLIANPRRFFSTTLLGTNACVVTATTVLTYFIIDRYGSEYSAFALLLSPIVLVFGEIVPKSIYQHYADHLAKKVGVVLTWVSFFFSPAIWVMSSVTQVLIGGVKKAANLEPRISREELSLMLASAEAKNSDMPPQERKLITKVLELSEGEVKNIMIPLVEIEMLSSTADVEAALTLFDLKGLSRLLVFEMRSHNIVGIVDMADCLTADINKPLKTIMKPVIYVPESMPLYELYETLQEAKEEVSVVVDEYGGAAGFVTLEDLLEEVFGEIRDEYEFEKHNYVKISEGVYIVNCRMEIEEANDKLKLGIPEGDYETIAGYILQLFSYIPKVGEQISDGNCLYIIKNSTPRAVIEVEVRKLGDE